MQLKKVIIVFTGLIVLLSCYKRRPDAPAEPLSTFRFFANGTLFEMTGGEDGSRVCILCRPAFINNGTHFTLHSSKADNSFESIGLKIYAPLLQQQTYSDTVNLAVPISQARHKLFIPPFSAAATEIGDFASVTITSIREGKYYDGTFNALFTAAPYGITAPKVTITNGEFRNIRF